MTNRNVLPYAIGLFLALLISAIVRNPKAEPAIYLFSQLAVFLILCLWMVGEIISSNLKDRATRNIRDNHLFVNFDQVDAIPPVYVKTAFARFESGFSNPNSFQLFRYATTWKDTLLDSGSDTVYTIYFGYLLKGKALYAKTTVFGDVATVSYRDAPEWPRKEYLAGDAKNKWVLRRGLSAVVHHRYQGVGGLDKGRGRSLACRRAGASCRGC